MSPNRRIVLNVIATYGRSLYALLIGLFVVRWLLQALGKTDYGLMGVVGGLSGFVVFLNSLMATAVGRFYAVNIGRAKRTDGTKEDLIVCQYWFNTAVSIHCVLPLILIIVGYPCGIWAVEHFLVIPANRIADCVWVWRWTCLSCFIGMVNVPFQAMYTAKQEIAELTVYSFATTTLNAVFVYYMVSVQSDWLVKYVFWTCMLHIAPQIVIALRAMQKYQECRIHFRYMWDLPRIKEICKFAYARLIANLSQTLSTQAKAILVNKFMGPDYNASMTIGTSLSSHAMTLSSSLSGAMWPAIANKAGEGDANSVKDLSFVACRAGAALILVFSLPLMLEINEVLHLWLVSPPPFSAEICCAIIISTVLIKLTDGYWMAILGMGKGVVYYSHRACVAGFLLIGVSWLFFILGCGMWSVIIGISIFGGSLLLIRLYTGQKLMGFQPFYWIRSVLVPLSASAAITLAIGCLPKFFMIASFGRVILTTVLCEIIFLPTIWMFVLKESERRFLKDKLLSFLR